MSWEILTLMIGTKRMETPARMEPCGIEEQIPEALTDLVLDVQDRASRLGRNLHPASAADHERPLLQPDRGA